MDTKLTEAFNKQVNQEFHSAYLYFAMSTYFTEIAMEGFSKFMRHKTSEKLDSAQKTYDYLILRDEKLTFSSVEEPTSDWINVTDVFSSCLSNEEFMLEKAKELYSIAKEVDDIGAIQYISKLVEEKLKYVSEFKKLVFRIKNGNIITTNVEHLNEVMFMS